MNTTCDADLARRRWEAHRRAENDSLRWKGPGNGTAQSAVPVKVPATKPCRHHYPPQVLPFNRTTRHQDRQRPTSLRHPCLTSHISTTTTSCQRHDCALAKRSQQTFETGGGRCNGDATAQSSLTRDLHSALWGHRRAPTGGCVLDLLRDSDDLAGSSLLLTNLATGDDARVAGQHPATAGSNSATRYSKLARHDLTATAPHLWYPRPTFGNPARWQRPSSVAGHRRPEPTTTEHFEHLGALMIPAAGLVSTSRAEQAPSTLAQYSLGKERSERGAGLFPACLSHANDRVGPDTDPPALRNIPRMGQLHSPGPGMHHGGVEVTWSTSSPQWRRGSPPFHALR